MDDRHTVTMHLRDGRTTTYTRRPYRGGTPGQFDAAKVLDVGAALCRMNGQRPSVRNVARELGISTNTVTLWRNGKTKGVSLTVADRVALRAGIGLEELAK